MPLKTKSLTLCFYLFYLLEKEQQVLNKVDLEKAFI